MTKTDMAWVLSLGFFSSGTSESRRNENICFADGAISKILQGEDNGRPAPLPVVSDARTMQLTAGDPIVRRRREQRRTRRRVAYVLEEEAEAEVGRVLLHEGPRLEHQRFLLLAEDDPDVTTLHCDRHRLSFLLVDSALPATSFDGVKLLVVCVSEHWTSSVYRFTYLSLWKSVVIRAQLGRKFI
jgi:hypothetical protein